MGAGYLYLLKQRRFLPLFLTQFFGAFNDNAYKLAMLTTISYKLSHSQVQSEYYQAVAGTLFILPFFLFSATSGQLADKYDKALLIRLVKVFEVIMIIIGGLALYYGNIFLMMLTLTCLGIHSSFFGPIKYAILPDHLPKQDLLGATGLIEASTFLAILLGTTFGTLSIGLSVKPYLAIFITLAAAFMGLISSLFIPPAPSSLESLTVNLNIWHATLNMLKQVNKEEGVLVAILAISWFWLIGAILMTKLPDYVHYTLGASTTVFALFLALFSTGIALGSLMINKILKGHLTLAVVPWAMFALSCFTCDLYWASPLDSGGEEPLISLLSFFTYFRHWRIAFDLFMLSFSAGLFLVPLYTYLQIASNPNFRARTIAANNIYNALLMTIGTILVIGLLRLHIGIIQVFLLLSILNLVVATVLWFKLKNRSRY